MSLYYFDLGYYFHVFSPTWYLLQLKVIVMTWKNSLTNHISTLKYIINIFTIEKMSSWTVLCELLHRKKRSYFLLKSLLPVKGDRELCKIMCNKNSLSILYCLTEQKHHLPAFCKRSIIVLDGLQNNTTFQDSSLIYRPLNWEDKQFFISQKN